MKKIKLIFISFISLSILVFLACNSNSETNNNKTTDSTEVVVSNSTENLLDSVENVETKELGAEYTAKYICPNHCKNSGSDKEGECIECGMELIKNPNNETE